MIYHDILYYIKLYYIILHYIILYYIILFIIIIIIIVIFSSIIIIVLIVIYIISITQRSLYQRQRGTRRRRAAATFWRRCWSCCCWMLGPGCERKGWGSGTRWKTMGKSVENDGKLLDFSGWWLHWCLVFEGLDGSGDERNKEHPKMKTMK